MSHSSDHVAPSLTLDDDLMLLPPLLTGPSVAWSLASLHPLLAPTPALHWCLIVRVLLVKEISSHPFERCSRSHSFSFSFLCSHLLRSTVNCSATHSSGKRTSQLKLAARKKEKGEASVTASVINKQWELFSLFTGSAFHFARDATVRTESE